MFEHVSRKKIGLAAVGCLVAAGMAGVVVVAQTARRAPLVELRGLLRSGPELGVSVRDVTEADAKAAGLGGPSGAYVQNVSADGAAAKAGVQSADVIVSFDGERVRSAAHLVRLVGETPVGRSVEVVLQRAGKRVAVSAALTEPDRPGTPRALLSPNLRSDLLREFDLEVDVDGNGPRVLVGAGRLGVTAETMSDQLRDYFGAANGVLVTSVSAGSPASTAGLKAGDVLTAVGGSPVRTVADLRRRVADASGDITVTVMRDKKSMSLTVRFPPAERPARPIGNPTV